MRWLAATLAVLMACPAFGSGISAPIEGGRIEQVRRIVIYGDSLSDNNDAADCDWCAPVTAAGIEIWNAATGGARTYDDSATCAAGDSYSDCQYYVERQMEYFDSACRVGTANSKNGDNSQLIDTPLYGASEVPTCVDDLPINSHVAVVIFAGTNDIVRVANSSFVSTYFDLTKAAYQSMLQTIKDNDVMCVMVIPPYVFDTAVGYLEANANLELLAAYLDGSASTSIADDMGANYPDQCVTVDMRDVIDEYTAANGLQATLDDLYFDCNGLGDQGVASGCIHFSTDGSALLGEEIMAAIWRADRQYSIALQPGSCQLPFLVPCEL